MTLWQDPPPQTRRQARENERSAEQQAAGQASRRAGTAQPTPGGEIPTLTTPYTFSSDQADRDAQGDAGTDEAAERPAIPASAFEEPGVTPPSRPNLPTFGNAFDLPAAPAASTTQDAPESSTMFKQASDVSQPEPVTVPVPVVKPEASAPAPATPASQGTPPATQATPERALTRRELRAMLQAQEANQQAGQPDAVIPVTFTPPADPAPARPAAEPEVASSSPTAWPFAPLGASSDSAASAASSAPASSPEGTAAPAASVSASTADSSLLAPTSAPAEKSSGSDADARSDEADSTLERQPFTPPTGHWSTAAELDDKNQPFDQIISRNVGQSGSATTTNALILPVLPTADATGPLTATGEILVTGSIDLPRGLGATGAHPDRIDSSDLDRLLDGDENEFNTSEVAPIRASRAISSHTSTRGVIAPPKKRGGKLPVVLIVTAGVLAVGVIGLLISAYVLKVF
ncbi:hypothetical protein [Leifsonia sp. NCR5]|uniref:hypothetical protein n=1 Tax=Leifsonia sp. NCR5 TaxID=1978342 RepID=UPI001179ABBA|nr:hypothetical protein [Leifsonia sp. NCR5]